jgi:hypothetical protein
MSDGSDQWYWSDGVSENAPANYFQGQASCS